MIGQSLGFFCRGMPEINEIQNHKRGIKEERKRTKMVNIKMKKVRADAEFSGGHFCAKIMEIGWLLHELWSVKVFFFFASQCQKKK
jgi:hypothetical protein